MTINEIAIEIIRKIRKGTYEDWVAHIKSGLEQSEKEAHNKAVQEAIDYLKRRGFETLFSEITSKEIFNDLENLKKR